MTDGPEEEPPFVVAIREHLGAEPSALSVVSQDFPLLAPRGGGLMAGPIMDLGPVQYVDVDVGPGGTLTCLQSGLMLAGRESGPLVVLVATGAEFGPRAGKIGVEALAPAREDAERFLADLRGEIRRRNVFRGRVISLEGRQFGPPKVRFHELPGIERDQIVLPGGVLERVERHSVGFTRHAERLRAAARHLRRGLLGAHELRPEDSQGAARGLHPRCREGLHRS